MTRRMKSGLAAWACVGMMGICGAEESFAFVEKVVRGESVPPVSITTNQAGHVLVDFGKHAFGWIEVDVSNPGPYAFIWGEMVDAGGCVLTNAFHTREQGTLRCARTVGAFEAAGRGVRVPYVEGPGSSFNPGEVGRFGKVMPFRWLEIVRSPFPVTKANVRQVPIFYPYDMDEERFACDSEALVRVHDFCKYSIRATTYTGKFIDGDRERLPYEADSHITQLSTYAMTSDHTLSHAMVDYLATHPTWPTEWKQFFIRLVHADWMYRGETDLVARHYDRMKRDKLWWHLRRADGLIVSQGPAARPAPDGEKPCDIVDWAMCYRDGFVFREVNAVVNALHYRNLLDMAEMAEALGKADDARTFAAAAKQTFEAYQRVFLNAATGHYRDGEGTDHETVQANAMALACGVVPEERKARVGDYVAGKGFSCSTYMAQFVLDALFAAGRADDAVRLMTSDAHRSWLGMMAQGATITMEFWDLTLPEPGRIPDMNHAWSSAPLNQISRHVLGVTPRRPGFAEVDVRPQPGPLTRLSGAVPTVRGAVKLGLERGDGVWKVDLDSPVPAAFEAFGCARRLPAGHHVFQVEFPN